MIDKVDDFLAVIAAAGLDLTIDETRDALWLSTHIAAFAMTESSPERPASTSGPAPDPVRQAHPPHSSGEETSDRPGGQSAPAATEMYAAGGGSAATKRGVAARSPAVAALPHKAALCRALRPLKRTRPSATVFEVDENATADQIAAEGLWVPVLRPAAEKWLDLTLVVDIAPSMVIWRQTLIEFRTLAERLGAFRRIRVVELDGDSIGSPAVTPEAAAVATQTNLGTLIDRAQRQAILVVTDGVGRAWREGLIQPYLRQWAQHGSVAVATVLPRRMWTGAGLKVTAGQASTPRPGAPNSQWTTRDTSRTPIPVLGLSERWLKPWAQLVAGAGGNHRAALLADHLPHVDRRRRTASPAPDSPAELVDSFHAAASPMAFRLASYLSAAWLNLPVMRLVQQLMLPDSDTSHLAEVFLGGLLRRVGNGHDTDPETAQYDFKSGVRDALNDYLTRDELLTVLKRSTEFVAERFGQSFNFAALLADPDGYELPVITGDSASRPLAYVSASVLAKLGGRYQSLAARLAVTGPAAPAAPVELSTSDTSGSEAHQSAPPPIEACASARDFAGYFLGVADSPDPSVLDARRYVAMLWPAFGSDILLSPTRAEVQNSLTQLGKKLPADGVLVVVWSTHTTANKDGRVQLLLGAETSQTDAIPLDELVETCARTRASQILIILEGCKAQSLPGLPPTHNVEGLGIIALNRTAHPPIAGFLAEVLSQAVRDWPATKETIEGVELQEWMIQKTTEQDIAWPAQFMWQGSTSAPIIANPGFSPTPELPGNPTLYSLESLRQAVQGKNFAFAEMIAHYIADPHQKTQAYAVLCEALANSGETDRAIELTEEIASPSARATVLASIASEAAHRGDVETAAKLVRDAEAIEKSLGAEGESELAAAISQARQLITVPSAALAGIRVFLSFTNTDRFQTSRLAALLGDTGADVVMDRESSAKTRTRSPSWIESERDRADVILVIVPGASGRFSPLFNTELQLISRRRSTPVIPVVQPGGPSQHYLEQVQSFADNPTQVLGEISQASIRSLVLGIAYAVGHETAENQEQDEQATLVERANGGDTNAMFDLGVLHEQLGDVSDLDAARSWYERAAAAGHSEAGLSLKALDAGRRNDDSSALAERGELGDALAAVTEAVQLYRELAKTRPRVYDSDLAESFSNQSNILAESGRLVEALNAIGEAVVVYRGLHAEGRTGYGLDLARALSSQSNLLAGVGRLVEALDAISEAVALCRRSAAADPEMYGGHLAAALVTQSSWFAEVGRSEDALTSIIESVDLYRQLAVVRPDVLGPDLARALSNLSARLAETGRGEEALDAISEAVDLWRDLAAVHREEFGPDLARALLKQSNRLSDLEQGEEALAAASQAVELCRDLAVVRAEDYGPDLAWALTNQSTRFTQLGRIEDALAAVSEAVEFCRNLAAANPERFGAELARALRNQSNRLAQLGRVEDALAAMSEAVDLYRELAADSTDEYGAEHAAALRARSTLFARMGRNQDALAAIGEAVQLYRKLAKLRPSVRESLAHTLMSMRARLVDIGDREGALSACREATSIYAALLSADAARYREPLDRAVNDLVADLRSLERSEQQIAAELDALSLPNTY